MGEHCKEYHLWLYKPDSNEEHGIVTTYEQTAALTRDAAIVHSYCLTLFSTSLLDLGWRLFIHFPSGVVTEVMYGPGVTNKSNLPEMIKAGVFGPFPASEAE